MNRALVLLDADAFWRLRSPQLHPDRRRQVAEWIASGIVTASTPLLLDTRAGRDLPPVDPGELRTAHQHLGVPALDYLIAAVAEDHGASILHYDADFERLAANTDLGAPVEALAPLGSLP